MLVITRRIGEKIVIGGGVTVTFLGFKGNQARIGFDAPPNVSVLREEVFSKIKDSEQLGLAYSNWKRRMRIRTYGVVRGVMLKHPPTRFKAQRHSRIR